MKRTPTQLYNYESTRIKKYRQEFEDTLDELHIDEATYDKLKQLFEWHGHARAIMSKAYQDMKADKKTT